MDTKQKAVSTGVILLGAIETPLLDLYVDRKMVADWLAVNGQNCPSEGYYPLYKRTSVLIPGITGAVALGIGLLADIGGKQRIKPEYQLYALEYGAAAVGSTIGKMIQVAQDRVNAGLPAFFPKCTPITAQQQAQYQVPPVTVCTSTGCGSAPGASGMYRPMASA